MSKRIIKTDITTEDKVIEKGLRPQTLDDYVGQEAIKEKIKIYIEAAKNRNDYYPHLSRRYLHYFSCSTFTTLANLISHPKKSMSVSYYCSTNL